ncbi:MAG TPA: hypothetical protein VF316_12580 [Polyangiaceae bacterium]
MKRFVLIACAALAAFGPGCTIDTIPDGLRRTPDGPGATVVFDPTARPLPEIPIPNDVGTFADPTSRTGRRINSSLFAPTYMERKAREGFNDLEGWGTYAPISVSFAKPDHGDPQKPALDLANVMTRMQGDRYAFEDDPVYVINLKTGVPAIVDVGAGNFPYTLKDRDRYSPNDPHAASQTLVFEDREEGAGLLQGDYRPDLDTDFDGVLDHPNTFGPPGQIPGLDNLLTWYERETDTLIMRPLLPLEEKTEYAVILTDRLKGSDGNPVKSPFSAIHHPQQKDAIARVQGILSDPSRKNYYGDLAGTGLSHVAFAWSFTTQPVLEDMRLLRDGLYGKGPFARFKDQFPAKATILPAAGKVRGDQAPNWTSDPICAQRAKTPYAVYLNDADIRESFVKLYKDVFDYDPGDVKALDEANSNIDHVVIGTYQSPFLEGDPKGQDPDARFHVNFMTGEGDVRADTVSFWLAIPKTTSHAKQPFPVALFGHGVGGNASESLSHGGNYARNGLATAVINMPQHGLPDLVDIRVKATAELSTRCLTPWVDAVLTGRALDRNGDGDQDPGWWWWTMHIANVRDNVRQGTLDQMQLTRILKTFDGKTMSGQDYNGDGKEDLAGDFDGNGTPDVGGPDNPITAAGESLGGIMSEILGGIDPNVVATAPMSGGAGLTDIGLRSYGVTESLGQLMSPLVIAIPATDRLPASNGDKKTNCGSDQMSVRIFAEDGDDIPEVELACLDGNELQKDWTVVVTNITSKEVHCAGTLDGGRFRVPIGASTGDRLDVQIYKAKAAVDSFKTCIPSADAPVGRDIRTFEEQAPTYGKVASGGCDDVGNGKGCAQFMDRFFPVGSALVSPQDGLGFARNTPQFRRFFQLGQTGGDSADPANYAPYYMIRPLLDPDGKPTPPHALLGVNTVGDGFVNIATGIAFARAAGAVPFLPPEALSKYPEYADYVTPAALYAQLGGRTPNEVLMQGNVIEGIARLARHPAGPNCAANYDTTDKVTCPGTATIDPVTCQQALFDADWLSEGRMPFDQQHPTLPLRLARIAGLHVTDATTLAQAWAPRIVGSPFTPDDKAWGSSAPLVGMVDVYLQPQGQHTWDSGDACKIWDGATYGGNMDGRFLVTSGKDLYYLSHPATHECLETRDCPMFK